MKKMVLTIALMLSVTPAFASYCQVGPQGPQGEQGDTGPQGEAASTNLFGVKADAPHLVHLVGGWYLGAEGGKDLNYTTASQGWFSYAKVTWEGTLFDFSKK